MRARLRSARHWVFDLDNTLYPAACDLFAQIDQRMTRFIAQYLELCPAEARTLQKKYYLEYGTTLNGLMQNHGLAPAQFLEFVHDIDHSVLSPNFKLRDTINKLPGQKLIFTNGSESHAQNVTKALGLEDIFDGVLDIQAMDFTPKPKQIAYDHLIKQFDLDPQQSVLFEDLSRNLQPAHAMGFVTVLVTSDMDWSNEPKEIRPAAHGETHAHVHFTTDDLTRFLDELVEEL